jgi:hypothetical protein
MDLSNSEQQINRIVDGTYVFAAVFVFLTLTIERKSKDSSGKALRALSIKRDICEQEKTWL